MLDTKVTRVDYMFGSLIARPTSLETSSFGCRVFSEDLKQQQSTFVNGIMKYLETASPQSSREVNSLSSDLKHKVTSVSWDLRKSILCSLE